MSHIIDSMYARNIGHEKESLLTEVIAHLFRLEQKLVDWEQTLPPNMTLVSMVDALSMDDTEYTDIVSRTRQRFRKILTLRYLNLRLLLHRPILTRLLDNSRGEDSSPNENVLLKQIGQNSLQICMQSANIIFAIVNQAIGVGARPTFNLIGAWWFSLYYSQSFSNHVRNPFLTDDIQLLMLHWSSSSSS